MKNKIILAVFLLISTIVYSQNKRGIALVIGNSNYLEGYLKNPVNDADAVGKKLRALGFDVLSHTDLDLRQMKEIANSFINKVSSYDVALFYYAGHGIQLNGVNYLIPLNAKLERENDIEWECLNLARVIDNLNYTKCKLKFVMIDACRNNPMERSFTRSIPTGGLVKQNIPTGTLISYATDYGRTAKDGEGKHSPYTGAFLELLEEPNKGYMDLFSEIIYRVAERTNREQIPVVENRIIERGNFCFNYKESTSTTLTETFSHSAEENNALGDYYYDRQDFDKAAEHYKEAARQGNVKSQHKLGCMYYIGEGVEKNYTEAINWYRKAAEQGDAPSQNNLARMYENGKGVSQNYTEAINWYRKAAEQGDDNSMYCLGWGYQHGQGVSKDLSLAKQWYQKAADKGHSGAKKKLEEIIKAETEKSDAAALYKKGNEYYNQGNYTEAVKYYRQAAEKGNADAQSDLGYCYGTGKGVQQDYNEAFKWHKKSAEQGNKYAQSNLALYYSEGRGVTRDYNEAVRWARKSADQGYSGGQSRLGDYYYYGQGVAKDYTEAVKWYRKSAEQGYEYGMYHLGWCYQHGQGVSKDLSLAKQWYQKAADKGHVNSKKQLEEIIKQESEASDVAALYKKGNENYNQGNYTEAVKYYRQAAEKGNADAQCYLGYCYETGKGVQQDYAEAVKWNKKSADQGNKYAQSNLAYYYSEGRGVTKDYNEAVKWARKSADQGYSVAQNRLGYYYYSGQGVAKDYTEALKWYRKAAEQGNEYGMYNMGWCYQYGNGVSKDLSLAKQWYQKAADKGVADAKKRLDEIINTSGQKQQVTVSGMVTDANGYPIIGAFILLEGTQNATCTDIDGKYTISVPSDGILIFSYRNSKRKTIEQKIAVNNRMLIDVVLK